eukprot:CAMPEP_0185182452 /NCGR_PEP_ID=MMETSP1140-20130426/1347_1 /TAXON_ID=298111 /ORGANISM="Pavlova sp., Strain CCMP459" /LENGTH=236 /DNA_ID=CAMNT_0027748397 /DNA_START=526 /DNA_END=1234 /DNA_ORIENTATION=-
MGCAVLLVALVTLGARNVPVLTSVDADVFALLDEEGNLDNGPALESGRLRAALHGVALDARVCLNDFEVHLRREVHGDDAALPLGHLRLAVIFEVGKLVDLVCRKAHLLECGHVHEHVLIAVLVGVLHVHFLHLRLLHALASFPRLLHSVAGDEVLELAPHKCGTLAWLDVEELLNLPHRALDSMVRPILKSLEVSMQIPLRAWTSAGLIAELARGGMWGAYATRAVTTRDASIPA